MKLAPQTLQGNDLQLELLKGLHAPLPHAADDCFKMLSEEELGDSQEPELQKLLGALAQKVSKPSNDEATRAILNGCYKRSLYLAQTRLQLGLDVLAILADLQPEPILLGVGALLASGSINAGECGEFQPSIYLEPFQLDQALRKLAENGWHSHLNCRGSKLTSYCSQISVLNDENEAVVLNWRYLLAHPYSNWTLQVRQRVCRIIVRGQQILVPSFTDLVYVLLSEPLTNDTTLYSGMHELAVILRSRREDIDWALLLHLIREARASSIAKLRCSILATELRLTIPVGFMSELQQLEPSLLERMETASLPTLKRIAGFFRREGRLTPKSLYRALLGNSLFWRRSFD